MKWFDDSRQTIIETMEDGEFSRYTKLDEMKFCNGSYDGRKAELSTCGYFQLLDIQKAIFFIFNK